MHEPSRSRRPSHSEPPAPAPTQRRAPSIAIAFRTLGRTLRHGYENIGTLIMISTFWYLAAILIIPVGAATAALHRITQPMTEERMANWRDFWRHLRADFRWGTLLTVILVIGFLLGWFNIQFYGESTSAVLRVIGVLFLTFLIVWSGIALFAFPLILRQEQLHLRTSFRNAALMTMANAPGVLISLILLGLVVLLFVVLPPLFLLIPGTVALWGEENARMLLVASGYIPPDEIADRARDASESRGLGRRRKQ